jgi:hypothetical protein
MAPVTMILTTSFRFSSFTIIRDLQAPAGTGVEKVAKLASSGPDSTFPVCVSSRLDLSIESLQEEWRILLNRTSLLSLDVPLGALI